MRGDDAVATERAVGSELGHSTAIVAVSAPVDDGPIGDFLPVDRLPTPPALALEFLIVDTMGAYVATRLAFDPAIGSDAKLAQRDLRSSALGRRALRVEPPAP